MEIFSSKNLTWKPQMDHQNGRLKSFGVFFKAASLQCVCGLKDCKVKLSWMKNHPLYFIGNVFGKKF